jgi:O-antigen/teichoic acid export membrane protein
MSEAAGRGRDIWVSLLLALGLWVMLAIAMAAVTATMPSGRDALDWPMIACALVAALYIGASWQFIPSVGWFVAGLALWTVVAFVLLAVLPVSWLELFLGSPPPLPDTDVAPPPGLPEAAGPE